MGVDFKSSKLNIVHFCEIALAGIAVVLTQLMKIEITRTIDSVSPIGDTLTALHKVIPLGNAIANRDPSRNTPAKVWCIIVWCFCFSMTGLTVLLKSMRSSEKMSKFMRDSKKMSTFIKAVPWLAMVIVLSACIVFPACHLCMLNGLIKTEIETMCHREMISCTVVSCLLFITYGVEVKLTRSLSGSFHPSLLLVISMQAFRCHPEEWITNWDKGHTVFFPATLTGATVMILSLCFQGSQV